MNTQRKNKFITYTIVTVLAGLIIFGAVVRCALLIRRDYEAQLKQNLYDVSSQCAVSVSSQIDSRYALLKSITLRFEQEGENSKNILDIYNPVIEAYHLRRIGYVDADGIAYSTDVSGVDLSYRYFFKKSMAGDVYISDILQDKLNGSGDNATVMTMPIRYNETGRIIGVSFITYASERLSEELAAKSFDNYGENFIINQNGTIVVSSDENIFPVASSFLETDFNAKEGKQELVSEFVLAVAGKKHTDGEIEINNRKYYYQLTPVDIMDGNATWYVLSMVDNEYLLSRFYGVRRNLIRMIIIVMITVCIGILVIRSLFHNQRKAMYSLAYESTLTGGPNLARFFYEMNHMRNPEGYIAYMNIEDFTHTSVAMGLEMSNEIVKRAWKIICDNMNYWERACHDKADSFVLYIAEDNDEKLMERLQTIRDEIHENGHELGVPWVYAKFGVNKIDEDRDIKLAYSKAEYTAYDNWGVKECVSFYNDEDHEKMTLNKSLEESFNDAITEKSFDVWFQPKYVMSGDKLTGSEALVRWRKIDGSLISPGIFIPLLEKTGEISRLDEYVFERVCQKQKEWKDSGHKIVPVSVNMSRASLYRDRIVDTYVDIINKYEISTDDVQLEVTESIVGENEMILQILRDFRSRGIKILMDDFGTGYSSLSTLNMKVFDTIKIDKSLTDEIGNDFGRTIMKQTIELGYALGLHVTVEGVETEDQLNLLKDMKCDDIQGFYFSKPLPEADYEMKL